MSKKARKRTRQKREAIRLRTVYYAPGILTEEKLYSFSEYHRKRLTMVPYKLSRTRMAMAKPRQWGEWCAEGAAAWSAIMKSGLEANGFNVRW